MFIHTDTYTYTHYCYIYVHIHTHLDYSNTYIQIRTDTCQYVQIRLDSNGTTEFDFQIHSWMYCVRIARTCLNICKQFEQNTYKYMQIRLTYVQIHSQNQYVRPKTIGSRYFAYLHVFVCIECIMAEIHTHTYPIHTNTYEYAKYLDPIVLGRTY